MGKDQNVLELLKRSDLVNKFYWILDARSNNNRDYGDGCEYSLTEVHMLEAISKANGITGAELAKCFYKTRAAATQMTSKLEEKGLIYRKRDSANKRRILFFLTDAGERLQKLHEKYDIEEMNRIHNWVKQTCSEDDLDAFYRVVENWSKLYSDEL